MLSNTIKKLGFGLAGGVLCCAAVLSINASAASSKAELRTDNTAVTDCWFLNRCGHKSDYYNWPGYTTNGSGWTYRYLGYYVDPNNSVTFSEAVTYSGSVNAGLQFGSDKAKASLGVSGSLSKTTTISATVNNKGNSRQYIHAGIQYADRSNRIEHKYRTYNPNWDATGWNNYCQYGYEYAYPSGRVETSRGYSLFTTQRNWF